MKGMPIPNTAALITNCWAQAEGDLRTIIKEKYPDRDEEMITSLFHAELERVLKELSGHGKVSEAFLADLRRHFPRVDRKHLSPISKGLVASVSFHSREVEAKTGGDLGLVLIRPDVHTSRFNSDELQIKREYKRGLLVQAKIFQRRSQWQLLSPTQKKILEPRLSYLALLLYRFLDQEDERRNLDEFKWQMADGATIKKINSWLRSDEFPKLQVSAEVLTALASDQIGTDDSQIVDSEIVPAKLRPSMKIIIQWRPGTPPPPTTVKVREPQTTKLQYEYMRQKLCN
jgi:hypothetical protein